MKPITKRMREILEAADLERCELNDVPDSTCGGLERRGLVQGPGRIQQNSKFLFPHFDRVKLTAKGVEVARSLKEAARTTLRGA